MKNKNSLTVWFNNVLPTLTNREAEVLKAIKLHGKCTLKDLESDLQRGCNTFSGRLTALKNNGIIKVTGTVKINSRPFSVYELNNK